MIRNIILLGPQGSGKSTQAEKIIDFLKIKYLSPGQVLRELASAGDDLGAKIANQINQGKLLPSDEVTRLMFAKLRQPEFKNGWLLDGFPRDIVQAQDLDKAFRVDKVFNIELSDAEAIERLGGRRVCKNNHTFHIEHKKSSLENICDICGEVLEQRHDDYPEAIKQRLSLYHQVTKPLIDYYKAQDKLVIFNGADTIDNIAQKIRQYLETNA